MPTSESKRQYMKVYRRRPEAKALKAAWAKAPSCNVRKRDKTAAEFILGLPKAA